MKIIDINKTDLNGRNIVWHAANLNEPNYLDKLAYIDSVGKHKVNFTQKDKEGKTPLSIAIAKKLSRCIASIIHKVTGYSLYAEEEYGKSPLQALCKRSSIKPDEKLKVLKTLLANGADINEQDKNGMTPLMLAAESNQIFLVDALLENGANPLLINKNGDSFFHMVDDDKALQELEAVAKKHNLNRNLMANVDEVKKYGHVLGIGTFLRLGEKLGLGGVVGVPLGPGEKDTVPVFTESWQTIDSYKALHETVVEYGQLGGQPHPMFGRIQSALQHSIDFQEDKTGQFQLVNAYKKNDPVILPVGYPGHGLGVALYKDKLIFTDRFFPNTLRKHECTFVYELKDTSDSNIRRLIKDMLDVEDFNDLKDKMANYVDIKNPILKTGDSAQTHGTCSYTNPRSNLEGLMAVMLADEQTKSDTVPADAVVQMREQAHIEYRKFVYAGRANKIDQLVKDMNQAEAKGDQKRANMLYDVAESFIKGRHNPKKNDGTDFDNSKKLYENMPPRLQAQFEKKNKSLAHKLQAKPEHKHSLLERLHIKKPKTKQSASVDAPKVDTGNKKPVPPKG